MSAKPSFDPARALQLARDTLDIEARALVGLKARQGEGYTRAVAAMLECRGRVVVMGMGKSGHVGRKIAATLASTGTPALFVHPAEAGHGDLGMIAKQDVILALSWSGETAELKNLTDYSQRHKIGLIAVTAKADSALAKAADVVLLMPQAREACPHNLAPTTSTLLHQRRR
ncbi:MAG: KpsF/GutQ family sugar-phosphate isomerase, partial [Caldimonas sp.]